MSHLIRPGMGTENALKVIGALIQTIRPRTILEIGAGDSTVAIAQALKSAQDEHAKDRALVESKDWNERTELLIPREAALAYDPVFVTIDNFSAEGCSAAEAWKTVSKIEGLNVKTVNGDFFAITKEFYAELGSLDFVWIDAGTLTDDVRFIGQLWPLLSPGGILAIHEPYFTTAIQQGDDNRLAMVRTPLWEAIANNIGQGVDILSLPEMHKYRQTGLGLLRKHDTWERPRNDSFQAEMMNVAEPPARFSVTGIRNDKNELLNSAIKKTGQLKQTNSRKVLYAIGLGFGKGEDIAKRLDLSPREVAAICAKLISSGLITFANGQYQENDNFWSDYPDDPRRNDVEMTDVNLETPAILDAIAAHLEAGRLYTEVEISNYCRVFTDDFARLRRKLIDTKRLSRDQNLYQVCR